ncbi:hypothetical protein ACFRFU_03305 [Streptomyces sp. NPDC056704]|uniref:elongation factor 1-alpha C-terminal domain-related protein n=1 Tax=Streptomyces sp. NPDC056704 TaxID=3345917 RepID=UPI0036B29B47
MTSTAVEQDFTLSHLDALESEAVHIFREVAGEFEHTDWYEGPALLEFLETVPRDRRHRRARQGRRSRVRAAVTNDLGRITLRTAEPLALDDYADVGRTGAFLLVDPADGSTLTAGMAGLSRQDRCPAPSSPQ